MVGRPQAIASIRTIPNDSGGSVVSRNRSAARSTSGSSRVGDRSEEVDAIADPGARGLSAEVVEQLAAAGDDEVDAPRRSRRASASIATSRRLKWWARSRVATNASDRRRRPGSPAARAARPRRPPGAKARCRRRSASRSACSGRRSRVRRRYGTESGVVGRQHADPVGGADQQPARRCARRPRTAAPRGPLPTQPVLVVDEQRLPPRRRARSRPSSVSSEPKMNG